MTSPRRPDTLFWVERANVRGEFVTLDPEESHHLLRVHRAETGATFEATDGSGVLYRCRLVESSRTAARGEVVERVARSGELPGAVRMLVGLPEMHAAESLVEHAVPLGASEIVFVECERSGPATLGEAKLERLRRLAVAGVKQSRRTLLPDLSVAPRLSEALEAGSGAGGDGPAPLRLVADPAGAVPRAGAGLRPQTIVITAVGPPGGFSDRETGLLREAGFIPISLGCNRLTTETAALALLCEARNLLHTESLRSI
ncbi:MAG TPA: RsmE family RNA methyltransferase [Candidatus Eisenbacteria bacterium]|nr:RsmE family RNA methyltransferase [Candidatus Eisenbacteria bacterium]